MTANNITGLIGNTPLLRLGKFSQICCLGAELFAKLEYFNPFGSVKDRIALTMVEAAQSSGALKAGGTIIEASSGNTGIALAAVAAASGYKMVVVMPDTMSLERRRLMSAYGAKLVLTEGKLGMRGAESEAERLAGEIEGSFYARQFENAANPQTHYETTARELWAGMDGKIDVFVSGVGTGGTISGVGRFLREQNPGIHTIAVEPSASAVLSGCTAGPHRLAGIGAGFIPQMLDTSVYDEIIAVSTDDAVTSARLLASSEGVLCGFSGGAALFAAAAAARRREFAGKRIVVILPDGGDRYLSTDLFV